MTSQLAQLPPRQLRQLHDPQAVLKLHGKSFHLASLVLDRATAERCARLYAFCRHLDDLADQSNDAEIARRRLTAVVSMLRRRESTDPVVSDFLELAETTDIPVEPAIELARGVMSDLDEVCFQDWKELHIYCYRVAGTVGLMMCSALGVQDHRAYPFAVDLGMAMQMTNIARDVREDAQAGRRYLPANLIGDTDPRDLIDPVGPIRRRLASAIERLLAEAEAYYVSGNAGLTFLPARSRLGIRIASRVYRQIGVRLSRRKFAAWHGRTVVPHVEKLRVAILATAEHLRSLSSAPQVPAHQAPLHRSLHGFAGVSPASSAVSQ